MNLPRTPARRELAAIRRDLDDLKATLRAVALAAADAEATGPVRRGGSGSRHPDCGSYEAASAPCCGPGPARRAAGTSATNTGRRPSAPDRFRAPPARDRPEVGA
jgi:hypothetical protein